MTRITRWLPLVGILGWLALTVPPPYAMEAAVPTVCDANPKTANLNFMVKDAGGTTLSALVYAESTLENHE